MERRKGRRDKEKIGIGEGGGGGEGNEDGRSVGESMF